MEEQLFPCPFGGVNWHSFFLGARFESCIFSGNFTSRRSSYRNSCVKCKVCRCGESLDQHPELGADGTHIREHYAALKSLRFGVRVRGHIHTYGYVCVQPHSLKHRKNASLSDCGEASSLATTFTGNRLSSQLRTAGALRMKVPSGSWGGEAEPTAGRSQK